MPCTPSLNRGASGQMMSKPPRRLVVISCRLHRRTLSLPRPPCRRSARSLRVKSEASDTVSETSSMLLGRVELEAALQRALKSEDYKSASLIKKKLEELTLKDPVTRLRNELNQAVKEERYKDAAQLRDMLRKLMPPAPVERIGPLTEIPEGFPGVPPNSEAVTDGIRVKVRSFYVPGQSMPLKAAYFFAYRIQIKNEGDRPVQLLSRHWKITDATGKVQDVRGPGVVGEQPVLSPGQQFEYSSATTIRTPVGTMEGEYNMVLVDPGKLEGQQTLEVKIGRFALNSTTTALP